MYEILSGPTGRFWIIAIVFALIAIALTFWYLEESNNPKKFYVPPKTKKMKKSKTKAPSDESLDDEYHEADVTSDDEDDLENAIKKHLEEDVIISKKEKVNLTYDSNPSVELDIMTWEKFKEEVKNPDFHVKFKRAIIVASGIKLDRYRKIRQEVVTASGGKKKTMHDIINSRTATGLSSDIIDELDKISDSLKHAILKTTEETVSSNLRKVVEIGESIVGRRNVLDTISQQIYAFGRNPTNFLNNFQNIVIFGPSGIGKTKLATTISEMYTHSGILARNNFIKTTKADFTTAYVNESGKTTREVLMRGLEGVVFIDEAYDLTPPKTGLPSKDHGIEAVTEMVNHLDKYIGLSIVIAGGYEKEMKERFLGANEGMDRRFFHKITLGYYSSEELFKICKMFLKETTIRLSQASGSYLWGCIDQIYEEYPEMFDKQASDMLSLSGKIGHVTFSNKSGDFEKDHRVIISEAVAQFTEAKGNMIRPEV